MVHIQIPAGRPRITYTAAGVGPYAYPFPIFRTSDLVVSVNGVDQTTGYSVTGAGQTDGGNVTFTTEPTSGATITLRRVVPIARTSDFIEGGAFRAVVINDELDGIVAGMQQLDDGLSRAVTVSPDTSPGLDLELPVPVEGRALAWGPGGTALTNTQFNPDETVSQATAAAASAESANSLAAQAAASAAAAAQAAANAGANSRAALSITLETGVVDYPLPRPVSGALAVVASYNGALRLEPDVDYIIASTHGPMMTLRLTGSVTPTAVEPGSWKAGDRITGYVDGAMVDAGLGPRAVQEVHLADGAGSARVIGIKAVTAAALADDIDMAGKVLPRSIAVSGLGVSAIDGLPLVTAAGSVAAGAWPALPDELARRVVLLTPDGVDRYAPAPSANEVLWNVPLGYRNVISEVDLQIDHLGYTLDTIVYLQLAVGEPATWVTTGYQGTLTYPGYLFHAISAAPYAGIGWPLLRSYGSSGGWIGGAALTGGNRASTVQCRLTRAGTNEWRLAAHLIQTAGAPGGTTIYAMGSVALSGSIAGLRLISGQAISPGAVLKATARW